MKILLVSNGLPPSAFGGVEIYTFDLSKSLKTAGHTIVVFCRESDQSLNDHQILDVVENDIRVIRVVNDYKHIASFRNTFVDDQIDNIFQQYLIEIQPEIIHFNHFIALSANLPYIADKQNIPFITTLHDFWPLCHRVNLIDWQGLSCPGPQNGVDCFTCVAGGNKRPTISVKYIGLIKMVKSMTTPRFRARLRQILFAQQRPETQPPAVHLSRELFPERLELHKRAILSSQRVLVPSNFVKAQFSSNGYPPERITVVPLGVNFTDHHPDPMQKSDVLTFAAVGSILASKGLHILIKAFKEVPAKEIRLRIFGREDAAPVYTRQLKKMASGDKRIQFMGPFSPDQRNETFNQIDILVIPSLVPESFSLVAREALLHRKPVIASRIGALPEVVGDKGNGYLFTPGQVDELKRIISEIANDPGVLLKLDCPGPKHIDTMEEHILVMEKLYHKVTVRKQS
jgi:glycosyltransferase involved in cell wall biosynthesis